MRKYLALFLCVFFFKVNAQNFQPNYGVLSNCGWDSSLNEETVGNSRQDNAITTQYCTNCNIPSCRDQYLLAVDSALLDVFLNVVVFRDDAGFSSIGLQDVEQLISNTEAHFAQANITFHHTITFVDSTEIRYREDNQNISVYDVSFSQGINIYICPTRSSIYPIGFGGGNKIWLRSYDVFGYMGPSNVLLTNHYVLTHELGHCFSLQHPFSGRYSQAQASCNTGDEYINHPNPDLVGDFCSDTKPSYEIANPTSGCSETLSGVDCNGVSFAQAQLTGDASDNLDNFMAYGPIACKTTFTPQQIARMRCYIVNHMSHTPLQNNSVTSDFIAGRQHTTIANGVNFIDKSSSNANSFLWDFGDGTTSSAQNPVHIYSNPGYYNVSLTVSDGLTSDTKVKASYVHITNVGYTLPYIQNFEGINHFPPRDWYIENPDTDPICWIDGNKVLYQQYWPLVGGNSSYPNSISIIGNNGLQTNAVFTDNNIFDSTRKDYLLSPPFDLSSTCLIQPKMSFFMSYLPCSSSDPSVSSCGHDYPGAVPSITINSNTNQPIENAYQYLNGIIGYHKNLKIYVSFDGGLTWPTLVYNKSDDDLKTVNDDCSYLRFTPALANHWRKEVIDLTPFLGNNNVRFKFEISGDVLTNSLYIDDFSVQDSLPSPIVLSVSAVQPQCGTPNGEITIQTNGGVTPFLYSIDGGNTFATTNHFINLAPGNYNIYVKDAVGCVASQSVLVNYLNTNAISTSIFHPSTCGGSDGSITLQITNSIIQPFNYQITGDSAGVQILSSNGVTNNNSVQFSNLSYGIYTVDFVGANGCNLSYTFTMGAPNGVYVGPPVTTIDACASGNGRVDFMVQIPAGSLTGATVLVYYLNTNIIAAWGSTFGNLVSINLFPGSYYAVSVGACQAQLGNFTIGNNYTLPNQPGIIKVDEYCSLNNGQIVINAQSFSYKIKVEKLTNLSATTILPVTLITGQYVVPNLGDGLYRVFLRDVGRDDCWVVRYITIEDITSPVFSILNLQSSYCVLDNNNYGLVGTPAGGVFSGPGITGNVFNPSVAGIGIHTITYTYNGTVGCSAGSISQTVAVYNSSMVNFSGLATTYCINSAPVQLSGFPNGGSFFGAGTTFNGLFDPSIAGVGTYTITYMMFGKCAGSYTQSVNVLPLPNVNAGADITICEQMPVTLNASGANIYNWSNGITNNTPFIPAVGTTTFAVIGTDINNCTNTDTVNVNVMPLPVVSFSGLPSSICKDAFPISLVGQPLGGLFSGTGIIGNDFNPSISGVGNFPITYTYIDTNGCSNSALQNITVNTLPTVSFSGLPSSICTNSHWVTLTGSPSGGLFSGAGISGNIFNPSISGVGSFPITYSYSDANGCNNSFTQQILVNQPPAVSFIGLPNSLCLGGNPVALTGNPSGGVFSGTGIIGNSFNPGQVGSFPINYLYTDANGCVNSSVNYVQVNTLPQISVSANPVNLCYSGTPVSTQLNAVGASTYQWSPSLPLNNSNISNPVAQLSATTTFTVYGISASTGCTGMVTETIDVNRPPFFSLGPDRTVCRGTSIQLAPTTLFNNSQYSFEWYIVNLSGVVYLNNSQVLNLNIPANLLNQQTYRLCVKENLTGCKYCDEITINPVKCSTNNRLGNEAINYKIFPNPSEGIIQLELNEEIPDFKINIYNQLGQKVFEKAEEISKNKALELDLNFLNSGVYYIELQSEALELKINEKILIEK